MTLSGNKPVVEVCLTPDLFHHYHATNAIVVAIDILRATSSICVALQYGALSVVPVMTIEESYAYKQKGFLIGAERQGSMVEGFDLGNSPFSYMDEKIQGRHIALTTTNGTQAINLAQKHADRVVAGSFLNIDVLANWLIEQNKNVICLCAGWKNTFNLEDTLFAGALTQKLLPHFAHSPHRDSALAAINLYQQAKDDMYAYLGQSSHRMRLEKLKIDEDVIYCLTPNQTLVIPVLHNGALIRHTDI